jgi:hypothetical protein
MSVLYVGWPLLLLMLGIKQLAMPLAVPTNYVILKMVPLPYTPGVCYKNGAVNCTAHMSCVI